MAGGLIDSSVDTKPDVSVLDGGTKVANAGATTFQPAQMTVDPNTQSVSGQLDAILGKGSPLIDRAEAGATSYSNSRGLINSSMAAQAGQAAAIDAALPIANADANIYGHANEVNTNAQNAALSQGATATNAAELTNAGAINDVGRLEAQGTQQRETLAQSGQQDIATQTLRGQQATNLANIEAQYKELIQGNASASDAFKTYAAAVATIMGDVNTSADAKTAAVDTQTQNLHNAMAVTGSLANVDISGLLHF